MQNKALESTVYYNVGFQISVVPVGGADILVTKEVLRGADAALLQHGRTVCLS